MNIDEIKGCIQESISKMNLQEAYDLIVQYKKIYSYDDEIASMEAIINIYDENYKEALRCIRDGLEINIYNSDLYFTMGNIYELIGKYDNSYLCYEQALNLVDNEENRTVILSNIVNLKDKVNINVNNFSIVILTYNNLEYTKVCIDSIRKYNNPNTYEIIIVDNNSTDETVEWLKEQRDIKYILNTENKGFPAGCNQGINITKKSNDIFLLNNDTVVMPNSIFNLRMGLYSHESIGATGATSNSVVNYQQIEETYESFDEYMDFALRNNVPNDKNYSEKVKLVGFAMLIKRNVLDRVGLLDERFTPGNYEDDDISLRIIKEGYKLLLCKDSYIHHFGSISFKKDEKKYSQILKTNEMKFKEKWGFISIEGLNIYIQLNKYINEKDKKILEVFCGTGANLLNLKSLYPDGELYGYEENKFMAEIAKINTNILTDLNYEKYKEYFDVVIISYDKVINNYDYYIEVCKKLLNNKGKIIFAVDAFKYSSKIEESFIKDVINIFEDKFMDNIHLDAIADEKGNIIKMYFVYEKRNSIEDVTNILNLIKSGAIDESVERISKLEIRNNSKNVLEILEECNKKIDSYTNIKFVLRRVEFGLNTQDNDNEIINEIVSEKIGIDAITRIIKTSIIKKIYVLNYMSTLFFANKHYDYVIPFLQEALVMEPKNKDILFNIGYILNEFGEKEEAIKYLEKIEERDTEITELIQYIKGESA